MRALPPGEPAPARPRLQRLGGGGAACQQEDRRRAGKGTRSSQVDGGRAKVFIRRAAVVTFAVATLSGASPSPVKHCFHAQERRARGEAPSPLVKVLGFFFFFVCVMDFWESATQKRFFWGVSECV